MRLRPDPLIVAILVAAVTASFVPATGEVLEVLKRAAVVAVGLLFLLYGARLSTAETISGLTRWRLHLAALTTTFVAFPLAGLAVQLLDDTALAGTALTSGLASGVLLLCLVPSTVQSCIVYTRIAGGNVAGAVVSASMSNLLGVFITPALVALLMTADASVDGGAVVRIVLQLFAPFVLGQLLRPLVGGFVTRRDAQLRLFDRGSIVLVVFVAFSEAAEADVWSSLSVWSVLAVAAVCAVLLAVAMGWTVLVGRLARMPRADRVALLFCGSNKSLASGLPIATVLFASDEVALIVLPLMLYHQMQIITGAVLARRLAPPDPVAVT
ncbi:bile acid:sodium symporter family protein [Aeromicrobium fastidiosum]|uniref:Bile acid:sodium symporter n=1 Tax=Aeromicrobium fastidiosum TaxID=52699 RepID=A0A641ALK9_9ACTN|nr:bile acid:sodium symporter family protein [Aeromicrobium fastidiosum]KAA1374866.1 bile acid:sodium symporter [Aeromicrobium fastidiosum]MBP2390570.1 sodium/bile acid cotransporter 7 [Aeromicrobium fastidiosum]